MGNSSSSSSEEPESVIGKMKKGTSDLYEGAKNFVNPPPSPTSFSSSYNRARSRAKARTGGSKKNKTKKVRFSKTNSYQDK